jgi:hypothetical protein
MKDTLYQLCQENGKIHIGCITNIPNIENKQTNNNHAIATLCGTVATCESLVDTDVHVFLSQIDIIKVTCYKCKEKYQDLTQHIKNDTDKYEECV